MSLRNFHVDARLDDEEILKRSDGILKELTASFRQMAANGGFNLGIIKPKAEDLNRIHEIVTEIDSRRLFYQCGQDEIPTHAMTSLYEARQAIRQASKGIWANPSWEVLVQEITQTLNDFCSKAEKLEPENLSMSSPMFTKFIIQMTDMRLKIWLLVAFLRKKVGDVIQPRNLPNEIWLQAQSSDI